MSPVATIVPALEQTLDAQAHNDEQARLIFNASPDVDSAMERVAALAEHGVPDTLVDELLADLARIYRSNGAERRCEQAAATKLDALLRDLRDVAANGIRAQLNVKALARALRPLLRDVGKPGAAGLMAQRALRRLVDEHADRLQLPSLAHELGTGPHAALLALLEASA